MIEDDQFQEFKTAVFSTLFDKLEKKMTTERDLVSTNLFFIPKSENINRDEEEENTK